MASFTVNEVNEFADEQFEWVFGNVIELCTDAAAKVKKGRPFSSVDQLCDAFSEYLNDLSEDGKVTVLKLHPELAGRVAQSCELTRESAGEQRCAGLGDLSDQQLDTMQSLNARYTAKFGFPFVICARENKVPSIFEGLQRRVNNTRDHEINIAIGEVKKICKLRILDIVKE